MSAWDVQSFFNGYTFGFCARRGFTEKGIWRESLREMVRTTGCNALVLPVCGLQEHAYSTEVDTDTPDVMSSDDVSRVCEAARELGLQICMKAMVNCRDGYWRAYIRFFDHDVPTEPGWDAWFLSYGRHVARVAEMAAENRADMLCVGCEMVGADGQADRWRRLISDVRGVYPGPVTYNCDKYQEDHVSWWDAVDVISSSGYYPMDEIDDNLRRIEAVSRREGKPFLFMEAGCPSRYGSEHRPNDWRFGGAVSEKAQADWYCAFTQALSRHPFVRGSVWWDWPALRLYPEADGPQNPGYCTYGKEANRILLNWSPR
ncbi:MAG: 1,4-beta-xylanase [Clostridia bacterium]|nr:1,4-beta-xylanase [Clostridia bacterium]